jgi:lipid A ethanolaminephosphotransferase
VEEAGNTENLLDVLIHAGVHVLWRDNNSDSKGVADPSIFEDFRSPDVNPVCDSECRDVGMLAGLSSYIDGQSDGDIVIVLHQMGNHGPAYYKRYPAAFEKFTPACQTNQLENCTDIEIGNAYDNAILYTDYFLAEVISFLKTYDSRFETAMYYMADHGESLGENGLYLHGLPYMLAPETQKHVASIMWFGSSYKVDRQAMRAKANDKISHDNYFDTVLGLMEIDTDVYDPGKDIMVHAVARNRSTSR